MPHEKAGWVPLESLLGCDGCVYKTGTIVPVPLSAPFQKPSFNTVDTWEARLNITHACSLVNKFFSDKPCCECRQLLAVKERCVAVPKPTHSSAQSCAPGFLSLPHVHTQTHILCRRTVAKTTGLLSSPHMIPTCAHVSCITPHTWCQTSIPAALLWSTGFIPCSLHTNLRSFLNERVVFSVLLLCLTN